MNGISFRKIKLFKGPEIMPRKSQKPSQPQEEEKNLLRRLVRSPGIYLFFFVSVLALLISYLPLRSVATLEVGEIATSDIIAPLDLTIEDLETTEKRRQEAEDAVLPVYLFDANVFLNGEDKIRRFFAQGRDWLKNPPPQKRAEDLQKVVQETISLEVETKELSALLRAGFPVDIEESLVSLLSRASSRGLVVSKNLFIHGELERGFTLIRGDAGEKMAKAAEVLDIREGKELLADEIKGLDISSRSKSLLQALTEVFIAPNITYNKVETEDRRLRARNGVETVFYTIKKGKVIIRKGDEAGAEAVKQIGLINQALRTKPSWVANFAGTFLLFTLLFVTLWYYLKSNLWRDTAFKMFLMMGSVFVLSLILIKFGALLGDTFSHLTTFSILTRPDIYYYAFAVQMGTLIFALLTSDHIALVYSVLNSLLVGYLFSANFYLMVFSFVGSLAASYGVKFYHRQRRTAVLRAGLFFISPVNIFVIFTIHLLREKLTGLDVLTAEIFMGILGALISAAVAFILLPVVETLFGFVTATKLLELTNSDLPVFRQMALEAPGSYHHSLIVATLAEKAAEEIKLDAALVKAGGLYHDIGKLKMPEYFIENRTRDDAHRDLKPSMSTLVIINHVKEGLEMARKLRLPRALREIIAQHHGTSLVRYFYQKAKEKADPDLQKVGEELYRYPGPAPRSKEAALVMLADSVEAASRSLKTPSLDNLKRVVTDIIDSYLQDGQLDECDFSLRELRSVASSFLSILFAIYHPRVEYPGFDFEVKKEKKPGPPKKNGNGNHQPAT